MARQKAEEEENEMHLSAALSLILFQRRLAKRAEGGKVNSLLASGVMLKEVRWRWNTDSSKTE